MTSNMSARTDSVIELRQQTLRKGFSRIAGHRGGMSRELRDVWQPYTCMVIKPKQTRKNTKVWSKRKWLTLGYISLSNNDGDCVV